MKLHTFRTHVGLALRWAEAEDEPEVHRVTITGDQEKVLYDGADGEKAKETYDYAVEHYRQRQIASEFDEEHLVEYFRKAD